MSIANYTELKQAIADWLQKKDLYPIIPQLINLGEACIARDVRTREQMVRQCVSISTEYFDAPARILELRNVQINTNPIRRLRYLTPEEMDTLRPYSTSGKPEFYTIIGDEFQVKPVPDSTYTFEIAFFQRYQALEASPTNWLLTNHPDVYLYAALKHAAPFLVNDERAPLFIQLYQHAVDTLNASEKKARYSGSALLMRSDRGNP